jgi:hypothetical protein
MRNSDLLTQTERQPQPSWVTMDVVRKRDSTYDKAGCHKDSGVSIRGTTFVE